MKKLFLVLSVCLVAVAYGQDANVKKLIKLAEKGDSQAQSELADAYFNGKGVKRSFQDAIMWLEKAAEGGNAQAQYQLALCYLEGRGVAKAEDTAVKWLEKAAQANIPEAQKQLALCYRDGRGVTQSIEKYYEWVEKNADNEKAETLLDLAKSYYNGDGVKKDINKARTWAQKAAAKGNAEAEYLITWWNYSANPNSPDALQNVLKVAEKGNPDAQYIIGNAYLNGKGGLQRSEETAIDWLEKAASNGSPDAQYTLGNFYFYGNSTILGKSYKKASDYYTRAAIKGNAAAQRQLSVCLYNGIGGVQSLRDAFIWVSKSVNTDPTPISENNLGLCYATGNGTRASATQAIELFQKAADEGDVMAQYNLGAMLLEETQLDVKKAFEYLEKAAAKNNLLALKKLGDLYYTGKYTNLSEERAFEYYQKAAQQTPTTQNQMTDYFFQQQDEAFSEVLYIISQCYAYGKGVKQSAKDADIWAIKAAELSNKNAFEWLQKKVDANDPKDPASPAVILTVADGLFYAKGSKKNSEKAFTLYEKLAKQENIPAQKRLIEYYLDTKNPKKDLEKGLALQEKIAKKGDAETQLNLGKYYLTPVSSTTTSTVYKPQGNTASATTNQRKGNQPRMQHRSTIKANVQVVERNSVKYINETKGVFWLNKAAEQNNSEAHNELGNYYDNKQEFNQAFNHYQKAANNNLSAGQYNLGNCYYNGTGAERSYSQAANLYKQAAREGYGPAQYRLGHCYYHGEGIKQSDNRAADWFEQACDNNEQRGCEMLKVVTSKK